MEFSEQLDRYLGALRCSNKRIAQLSGLSEATISRYRKGERVPPRDGEQIGKLAKGIEACARQDGLCSSVPRAHPGQDAVARVTSHQGADERGVLAGRPQEVLNREPLDFSFGSVCEALNKSAPAEEASELFCDNFDVLVSFLKVNVNDLARSLNYDASYISRIRSHQRKPQNIEAFARGVSGYVAQRYVDAETTRSLASLIGCPNDVFSDVHSYCAALERWLCSDVAPKTDRVGDFLKMFDEFDLAEYTRSIQFDTLRVPAVPLVMAKSKSYYGLREMRAGELDFLKATALSKSSDDVFMYSGMPMEDLADDKDFSRKWMYGVAVLLKKGLRLDIVHDLNRPFEEMMLGLLAWVPLYMTGQVSPYYFPGSSGATYSHLDYVSGAAALHGDCVVGCHDRARYQLSRDQKELAYFRTKARDLLKKARPLMDIYREDSKDGFWVFLAAGRKLPGARRNILAGLPLYVFPEDELVGILERHTVSADDQREILRLARSQKEAMEGILSENSVVDKLPLLDEAAYEREPLALALFDIFFKKDVMCSFAEYQTCLEHMQAYSAAHDGYSVKMVATTGFRNIQIETCEGSWAKVSKGKSPSIHFVIRHPHLRAALENMVFPVVG